jgi:hypothetical protein
VLEVAVAIKMINVTHFGVDTVVDVMGVAIFIAVMVGTGFMMGIVWTLVVVINTVAVLTLRVIIMVDLVVPKAALLSLSDIIIIIIMRLVKEGVVLADAVDVNKMMVVVDAVHVVLITVFVHVIMMTVVVWLLLTPRIGNDCYD